MITVLPGLDKIPHFIVLPYYIILPGYAFTLVLRNADGIIQTLFFSFVWSVVIVGTVFSLTTLGSSSAIPLNALLPVLTVILTTYGHYHGR